MGESYWIGQLNSGVVTLAAMAASFLVQPEAGDVVSLVASVNMTAANYINIGTNHFALVVA